MESLYTAVVPGTNLPGTNLRLWRRPSPGGLGGLGHLACVKPDMLSQHLNRRLRLRTLAHPGPGSPLAADELLAIIYSR